MIPKGNEYPRPPWRATRMSLRTKGTVPPPVSPMPQTQASTVSVAGQLLRVAIRPGDGARTPLLLINGIGANLEVLQPFVDSLAPALDVLRFDPPGVGGSPAPVLPYRFPALAWLVARLLDRVGYERVDVLGVSWGGLLAQQLALQDPERCRRLILVSTGPGALMVPGSFTAMAAVVMPWHYVAPAHLAAVAGELYGGSVRAHPEHAREFASGLRWAGSWGYACQLLGGMGWTSLPWLPLLQQPTLILSGDDDPLVPPINAEIMHRLIPRSQLHIFHDGHLGLGTKAQELALVVDRFLTAP
jgi:poly(3-hydroxyalkanoate) depolymerase